MSEMSQGDGWWQGSDLKWYPPASPPESEAQSAVPPPVSPLQGRPSGGGLPRRSRTPIVVMAVITVVAVLALVGVLVYRFAFPASRNRLQPVTEAALKGLWLSPDGVNAAMGATGMTVTRTSAKEYNSSAATADKACLPIVGPVEAGVYAASDWTALSGEILEESHDRTHLVEEFAVLFPSAQSAQGFFTASTQQWPACGNRHYMYTEAAEPGRDWSVGPVSHTNGILSATKTEAGDHNGWACQRALTEANNVVIDVVACAYTQSEFAVKVAQLIAAKVPT